MTQIPSEPCHDCPFTQSVPPEAQEYGMGAVVMLCHDSACLDGQGTEDKVCRGWLNTRDKQ